MSEVKVICANCGTEKVVQKKQANTNIKNGWKHYCSSECMKQSRMSHIKLSCSYCGKEVKRTTAEYNKSKSGNVFCSSSCAAKTNNIGVAHNYIDGSNTYREKALKHYGSECSVCGYNIESVLEVHHRDSNRKNNKLKNLDVLCPTHHREYHYGIRCYEEDIL